MPEEFLPKPKTDLPTPEKDLPLPEKELPAHATESKQSSEGLENENSKGSFILKSFLLGILFVILVVLIGGGSFLLGRNTKGSSDNNQQVVETQVSAPTSSPAPTHNPRSNLNPYINDYYGYSINFPADWFNLKDSEGLEQYFSNKKIGSPMEMGSEGIWANIRTDTDSDFYDDLFNAKSGQIISTGNSKSIITKLSNLDVNGLKTVKYISETPPDFQGETAYFVNYAIKKDEEIFIISFLTVDEQSSQKYMKLYDQITSTFKFTDSPLPTNLPSKSPPLTQ